MWRQRRAQLAGAAPFDELNALLQQTILPVIQESCCDMHSIRGAGKLS